MLIPTSSEDLKEKDSDLYLSEFNQQVMDCFASLIKRNSEIEHIDLTNTGLIPPAIKFICSQLRRAQALRALHLCGNKGINSNLILWI